MRERIKAARSEGWNEAQTRASLIDAILSTLAWDTANGLVHAVQRAARRAQPTYAALQEQIRGSPVVTPDETGWKVAGRLHWLWAHR